MNDQFIKKLLLLAIYSISTIHLFAQPTGDIEKDTALANQYYHQVRNANSFQSTEQMTFEQQAQLIQQAIQLYEAHPFHPKLIEIKGTLGWLFAAYGSQMDTAFIMAQQTYHLAQDQKLDNNHPSLFFYYQTMGIIYSYQDMEKCAPYYEQALQMVTKPSWAYFQVVDNLAEIYANNYTNENSYLDKLKILLDEANSILQQYPNLEKHFDFYYFGRAKWYKAQNDLTTSVIYTKKRIMLIEKYNLRKHEVYTELIQLYALLKNYEEAMKWQGKLVKVYESRLKKGEITTEELAWKYLNLGFISQRSAKYQAAIDNYLKGTELLNNEENVHMPDIYHNISNCYYRINQLDKAEQFITKYRHRNRTMDKNLYAKILSEKKDFTKALEMIHEALIDISVNFKNRDVMTNPSIYDTYSDSYWGMRIITDKAAILRSMGKAQQSKTLLNFSNATCKLGLEVYHQYLQKKGSIHHRNSPINALRISNTRHISRNYVDLYQMTHQDIYLEQLFSNIEKEKGLALLETLTPSELPDSVLAKKQALHRQVQAIGQKELLATIPDSISYYQNKLFEANVSLNQFNSQLLKDYPKRVTNFYNISYVSSSDVQRSLDDQTLLISYANIPRRYADLNEDLGKAIGFTISSTSQKIYSLTVNQQIERNIRLLTKLCKSGLLDQVKNRDKFIEASYQFYQTFLKPLEAELKGKTKLIIIQDGTLFNIPFEVILPTDEKKPLVELDYLIKKYAISYQYSATIRAQIQQQPAIQDYSLLAFAPIFKEGQQVQGANRAPYDFVIDSLYNSIDHEQFTALPYSEKEVKTIAQTLAFKKTSQVLLEKSATKKNLITSLEQPFQFVHIATHGIVNHKNPLLSALACYRNQTDDESLLFANEIQMQDIQVDLVVLSSCESGIGELIEGEGIMALNRSFIYAGARNVLFSLWKISDLYSSELMIDFYKSYLEMSSYSDALRAAKLKMLSNPATAMPRYWAPFVLMGE